VSGGHWSKGTRDAWFYALLALSAGAVAWIFWTYLYVLLYAAVTVVCCWPAYALLLRLVRGRAWLASGLTTLGLGLLVFVPLAITLWLFALEVQEISQILIDQVQSGELARQIGAFLDAMEPPAWLDGFVPELPPLPELPAPEPPPFPDGVGPAVEAASRVAVVVGGEPLLAAPAGGEARALVEPWLADQLALTGRGGGDEWSVLLSRLSIVEDQFTASLQDASLAALRFAGAELPGVVNTAVNVSIDSVIYVFGVLVLFVEGPALLTFFRRILPLDTRYTDDLFRVFGEFSRNLVVGSLATALIQAVVAGAGFAIAGLEKVVFLSILLFLGSFVPVVGTPVVWVPVVGYLVAIGDYGMATFLAIWCLVLVGTIDNVLKPLFIRGSSEMHALLVFLAVFGGMYWMGLAGILVGPTLVAIFLALYRIYERDFLGIVATVEPPKPNLALRLLARALLRLAGWARSAGRVGLADRLTGWANGLVGASSAPAQEPPAQDAPAS
jgi:predicted PurR-regulated permease PerM